MYSLCIAYTCILGSLGFKKENKNIILRYCLLEFRKENKNIILINCTCMH